MELQYYGANCIRITTKKATIIVDGDLGSGQKSPIKNGDIVLSTKRDGKKIEAEAKLVIDSPGEYEVGDTSVIGIPARAYGAEPKTYGNTVFKVEVEEVKVAIIGNIHPGLSDSQLELLGEVDVVIIPVGNNESTLSGLNALDIIKKIEPYLVIPTHYADQKTKYANQQATLEEALKELAMEISETTPKVKLKAANFNEGDATRLIVLDS